MEDNQNPSLMTTRTQEDKWMTVHDAAEYAACCTETIKRAARRGDLRAARAGYHYRFRVRDIDAWMGAVENHAQEAA
jgi:excisionase family DNA binding protein